MRFAYTVVFYCLLPFIFLRLIYRGLSAPAYRERWKERFGFLGSATFFHSDRLKERRTIWIHAVSVGEVFASVPLVEQLLKDYPERRLMITTMTPTGSEQVQRLFGQRVLHGYVPYDLPGCMKRFLDSVRPELLIIVETEIWPNMISLCHQRHIDVVLANGRLSEKSYRGYQRFATLFSPVLKKISLIAAQAAGDAERFVQLGAGNVRIIGNIKSDIVIDEAMQQQAEQFKASWIRRDLKPVGSSYSNHCSPVIVAASTHKDEDEIILNSFSEIKETWPCAILLLVPRHPERFLSVEQLCLQRGFTVLRKSNDANLNVDMDIILGDTMGDLLMLFGVADLAIMGGTFVERGGHNFLEPAAWGLPIVSGQSTYNFSVIAEDLMKVGGLVCVRDGAELTSVVMNYLSDDTLLRERGQAAKNYFDNSRGALNELLNVMTPYLKAGG